MPNDLDASIKKMAKDMAAMVDQHIELLQFTSNAVEKLSTNALNSGQHKRYIYTQTALTGMNYLVEDLKQSRSLCMQVLNAKNVPIVVKDKGGN